MARTHFVVFHDDLRGHLLASIATKYIKENFKDDVIKYQTDLKKICIKEFPTSLLFEDNVDWAWLLGTTPSEGCVRICGGNTTQAVPAKVVWFDDHIGDHSESLRKPKPKYSFRSTYYDADGARGNMDDMCQRMWEYCFPDKPLPVLIKWIDQYNSGTRPHWVRAFVLGLELVQTNPLKDTEDIWEKLFSISNPVRWGKDEITDKEILRAMQTDASYQIMNMGSILDTHLSLKSANLIRAGFFSSYVFVNKAGERVPVALANADDLDIETILTYFLNVKTFYRYVGWWKYMPFGAERGVIEVKLLSTHEESNAVQFANEIGKGYGNKYLATARIHSIVHEQWDLPIKLRMKDKHENYIDDDGNLWGNLFHTYSGGTSWEDDGSAVEDDSSDGPGNDG